MNYATSTQYQNWTFTEEKLNLLRSDARKVAIEAGIESVSQTSSSQETISNNSKELDPLSIEEELTLLDFYHTNITYICKHKDFPLKVKATALIYLKRFYIYKNVMNYDPSRIFAACIYLAAKVEEYYIKADVISNLVSIQQSNLLKNELLLLKALNYDLMVHKPYQPIDAFTEDIGSRIKEGHLKEMKIDYDKLIYARKSAYNAADCLMLTDAPLIFTPSQLGLASMRSGVKKVGGRLDAYIKLITNKEEKRYVNMSYDDLIELLSKIDSYGVKGSNKVNMSEARDIDIKLKKWFMVISKSKKKSKRNREDDDDALE